MAVTGLVGGAIFSLALGIAEGRRRFDEMSLPSFAVLGAVGGLFISLLFAWGFFVFPLLGAGSAAGSLGAESYAHPAIALPDHPT